MPKLNIDGQEVEVPAGTYDLAVFGDGQTPDDAEPVLIAEAVEVPGGINATVTANLEELPTEAALPALRAAALDKGMEKYRKRHVPTSN